MTKLYIVSGPMEGASTELKGEVTFIGRASDNDIQIKDRSISRKHVKIIGKNSRFFIEDLGSENGTWINGKPIRAGYEFEVEEGFPIAVGDTLISLGKKCSEDSSQRKYSISLSGEVSRRKKDVSYKERRVINQREFELIYEISSVLMQSLDTREICEKIMDSLFSSLKRIDSGAIILVDDNTGELKEVIARSREKRKGNKCSYSQTIVNRVIRNGSAVMMSDTSQEDEANLSDSIVKSKIKSIMCVPLISKSKTRGVIYIHSVKEPYGFRKDDLFLLTGLSYPAAVTLENALLYSKRKQAEEALKKARDELEERVEERTAELSKTNALLHKSEEKYRNLFDNISDFIYTHDLEGRFLTVNSAAAQTLGYTPEDLIGQSISEFMLPEYRQAFHEEYLAQIKKEGSLDGVLKYLAKDSSQHYIEYRNVLVDQEGKEPYVSGIGRNITDRILSRREVRKLEQQLQHAQKMEAIGTLAGGIAHDFNNLLSAIMGYTELSMFEALDGSPTMDNLNEILKASHRAKDMVRQILAFSRKEQQARIPMQVGPIVKEALKMIRNALPSTIEVSQYIDNGIGVVEADATQIHQVLMNLSTNAAHAMRENGGILDISLTNVEVNEGEAARHPNLRQGVYVRLNVSDTGEGMSSEVRERIFEPYFTTKEKSVGTGLGLAVTHGIVKSHGGAITVESKPGIGSTFRVYIPRIEKELTPKAEATEVLPAGSERILFVDDEQTLVEIGKQMLEKLGYEVTTRTSSIEALELFRVKPDQFDLVITDMTMPNMTGDKLAKEIMGIRADIPIVLCTGYSEHIGSESAEEMAIRGFIMKPLSMNELANAVRNGIDKG